MDFLGLLGSCNTIKITSKDVLIINSGIYLHLVSTVW